MNLDRRRFLKSVALTATALVIGDNVYASDKKLKTIPGFEDPIYSIHDKKIIKYVSGWNSVYEKINRYGKSNNDKGIPGFSELDPNLVKSMIIAESGGHVNTAFKHDPMQIANDVCTGLETLRDGGETSIPKNGYKDLKGIKETPTVNGKIRYDLVEKEHIITPRLSIKYGVRWLWQKRSVFEEIEKENGPLKKYYVKKGDILETISKKERTTVDNILKNSKIKDPNQLSIGQEIKFKEAKKILRMKKFISWRKALEKYNGSDSYADKVLELYNSSF